MEYRLLIDLEAISVLDRLPKTARLRMLAHFTKIRSFPGNYSDYHETDDVGRRVEISVYAGWAIQLLGRLCRSTRKSLGSPACRPLSEASSRMISAFLDFSFQHFRFPLFRIL